MENTEELPKCIHCDQDYKTCRCNWKRPKNFKYRHEEYSQVKGLTLEEMQKHIAEMFAPSSAKRHVTWKIEVNFTD